MKASHYDKASYVSSCYLYSVLRSFLLRLAWIWTLPIFDLLNRPEDK
jgi:hypothetical protein